MAGPPTGLTAIFFTFHIAGGIVGLPIVFLSIVASRQISRHPTLLNFCATWFFSSLIYTLLLFAGKQDDEHPPFNLCLAQASMVNGAFPMTSVAGVALVAHIWHGLGPSRPWSQFGLASRNIQTARLTALLLAPYLVFLAFTVAGAIVGHTNPDRLKSTDALFYCTLNSSAFNVFVPTFAVVAMVFILLFEVLICVKIYQNAYIRAGIDRSGFKFFMLRLAGFSIYAVIALVVAALFLSDNRKSTPYILQASLPLAVLIFIGTQKEVLATWSRWLRLSTRNGDKFFDGGLHQRSRSTTALMEARPPTPSLATPDFVQLNEFPLDKTGGDFGGAEIFKSVVPHNIDLPRRPGRPVKTGLSGMETFFNDPARPNQIHTEPQRKNYTVPQQLPQQVYEPPRPQESVRPYDVQIPVEPRPHNNFANEPIPHNSNRNNFGHNFTGLEKDSVRVIATQKETISRLLEEAGYMNKALDRLKNIEQILHKTQNAVVGERRTVTQLKGYVSQMEGDLQNQSNAINNLLVANKELEDKHRYQEEELHRLAKEANSLSDALQHSVKNEMQWKDKYSNLKKEHSAVVAEVTALKNERDVLLDIWSTLDSPVDWEMQKGRGPSRGSPPFPFPELAEKFRQRASTPVPRPFSKSALRQTRRQTDAAHPAKSGPAVSSPPVPKNRTGPGVPMDSLDRLRPRMLELSGKMELSEKVGGLEELVREQTAMIEQLEAVVDEERRERIRLHVEGSMGSWSIPDSISSSMIAERDVASHASASEAKVT